MTAEEFIKLRDFIYRKTGIYFEEQKMYYVKNRVESRIEATGSENFRNYFAWLRFDVTGQELQQLLNTLTVNETYFFREYYQLKCFAEEVLPEILERKRKENMQKIRIWSAGCSTGEEPYTLAIIMEEMLENINDIEWEIYATDINTDVLKKAEMGLYSQRSVRLVPEEYKKRYLYKKGEFYEVVPELKKKVIFFQLNLMDAVEMRKMRNFDVIFCRNVLIYFDDASRRQVAIYFYEALVEEGYIFLGHSESMSRITPIFKLRKYKNAFVYQK
ncbi:CheR family methyltransferase [Thermoanaerobacter wiegelii]|uniref:protein-glutamate O-methyltransferase n=1 Tax=Thermoanaerobacter wiegelii Rt8.B1 TaxID=697303 RepID=G2MVR0_9THEO|nr:protein-glutamate O-methyltransferase CheR [Thermoanaerobacter wiegelii]AEM79560.1 MCP methyltransferase, CheR-type [Thermoanaerobacter wiegelii Rt8.B1]